MVVWILIALIAIVLIWQGISIHVLWMERDLLWNEIRLIHQANNERDLKELEQDKSNRRTMFSE